MNGPSDGEGDGDGVLRVAGLDAAAVASLAGSHGGELFELAEERPDLEQAFLHLTDGKAAIR